MRTNFLSVCFVSLMLLVTINSFGQFQQHLSFNDSNLVVDCGSMPNVFDSVTTYTVEARVKFNRFTTWGNILCKRTYFERDVVIQCYDTEGQIGIAVSNSGYGYTFNKITANEWHHLAIVYDGNNATNGTRLKFYIDGIQQTLFFIGVVPPVTPVVQGSRFCLGSEYNDTTAVDSLSQLIVPFDGSMDEIRIWNIARTGAEINSTMNAELTLPQSNLIAYYQFNQGRPCGSNVSDSILIDETGNYPGLLWNFNLDSMTSNFVNDVDTSVNINGALLSANASPANYQWYDCSLNSIINGQISGSFIPPQNGSYAVIITQDLCLDTSSCYQVELIGVSEADAGNAISIYPNPLQGGMLHFSGIKMDLLVTIMNEIGKVVDVIRLDAQNTVYDADRLISGIYFVKMEGKNFLWMEKMQVIK